MRILDRPSPNHGPRKRAAAPDMLILHYTGMQTAGAALDRLCDPAAEVSAHYVIDEDGTTHRLVDEERRAWHAGRGFWRGETDINSRSVGIELVNPGHEWGYRPFPEAQMAALEELAGEVVRRWSIPPLHVLGHSDVAPLRKEDPGELFDWPRLARSGIGAWPVPVAENYRPWDDGEVKDLLGRVGYGISWDGTAWDGDAARTLTAFRRHWAPERLDGLPDEEVAARLRALARLSHAMGAHGSAVAIPPDSA